MTSMRSIADQIDSLDIPGLDDGTPDEQPAAAEAPQGQPAGDELAGDQTPDQPPADDEGTEDSPEGSEEAASTKGRSEQPPEGGEEEELPDTLTGLAEYLGLEVDEMLGGVKHKIGKSGQEQELTLREILDGSLRTADYTQKTQDLADSRRAFEDQTRTQTAQYEQAVAATISSLNLAEQQIQARYQEIQPMSGQVEYQAEYAAQVASLNRDLQALQQAKASAFQDYQNRMGQLRGEYADRQRAALLQARPNMDVSKDGQAIGQVMTSLGYSSEETMTMIDHRLMLGALELHELREENAKLKAQQAGVKDRAKKKLKRGKLKRTGGPGKPRSESQKAQTNRLNQHKKLKKTGKARDAAPLFERFIPEE